MNRAARRHLGPEPKTTDVSVFLTEVLDAFKTIHAESLSGAATDALATLETFCHLALRVMADTPLADVRSKVVTVAIAAHTPREMV